MPCDWCSKKVFSERTSEKRENAYETTTTTTTYDTRRAVLRSTDGEVSTEQRKRACARMERATIETAIRIEQDAIVLSSITSDASYRCAARLNRRRFRDASKISSNTSHYRLSINAIRRLFGYRPAANRYWPDGSRKNRLYQVAVLWWGAAVKQKLPPLRATADASHYH